MLFCPPPELHHGAIDGGRFATSDLNDLIAALSETTFEALDGTSRTRHYCAERKAYVTRICRCSVDNGRRGRVITGKQTPIESSICSKESKPVPLTCLANALIILDALLSLWGLN